MLCCPIDCNAAVSADGSDSPSGSGTSSSGLPATVRAEVIHREVVAMRKSHAENGARLPPEPLDRLEHLQKCLRCQVLGVVSVADAHVQIAVDAVEVDQVQLFERCPLTLLATLDETADVSGRVLWRARRARVASSAINPEVPGSGGLVTRRPRLNRRPSRTPRGFRAQISSRTRPAAGQSL